MLVPSSLVHNSMIPYEQNVSRTLYWLSVVSQSDGSDGGMRIE